VVGSDRLLFLHDLPRQRRQIKRHSLQFKAAGTQPKCLLQVVHQPLQPAAVVDDLVEPGAEAIVNVVRRAVPE